MRSTSRSPRRSPTPRPRLRWLGAQPPDLEEVRQALGRIVKDGNRAGDVIGRIRDLIKKAPPRKDRCGHQRGDPRGDRTHPRRSGEERRLGADATRGRLAAHSRRSGPTAASDPQLDRQRRAGDERRQRGRARIADQHRDSRVGRRAGRGAGFGSGAGAGERSSACSMPSTRPKPTVWGWGCRSAVRSSKRTADDCGRARTCPAAPSFNSRCQATRAAYRDGGLPTEAACPGQFGGQYARR